MSNNKDHDKEVEEPKEISIRRFQTLKPYLGIIWSEIVAPPLILAKTVRKSYQTNILGLFQSYISHLVQNVSYISPISHPYIKQIQTIVNILKCELFDFQHWYPYSLFGIFFFNFWNIFVWATPLKHRLFIFVNLSEGLTDNKRKKKKFKKSSRLPNNLLKIDNVIHAINQKFSLMFMFN